MELRDYKRFSLNLLDKVNSGEMTKDKACVEAHSAGQRIAQKWGEKKQLGYALYYQLSEAMWGVINKPPLAAIVEEVPDLSCHDVIDGKMWTWIGVGMKHPHLTVHAAGALKVLGLMRTALVMKEKGYKKAYHFALFSKKIAEGMRTQIK